MEATFAPSISPLKILYVPVKNIDDRSSLFHDFQDVIVLVYILDWDMKYLQEVECGYSTVPSYGFARDRAGFLG